MNWKEITVPWTGTVYRFASIDFASKNDLVSGIGAKINGGRWNPKGSFPSVYSSLTPETALAESRAHFEYYGLDFAEAMPFVLTSLQIKLARVVDFNGKTSNSQIKSVFEEIKEEDWRQKNHNGRLSLSQKLGEEVYGLGFEGLLVPSFAIENTVNLVIFPEHLRKRSWVRIANDDKLPRKM
jgi:RES domain-containing protein